MTDTNQRTMDSTTTHDRSRRDVLRTGAGALAALGLPVLARRASAQTSRNTISITSTGENKVAVYIFTTSGGVEATGDSSDDHAGAYDATGRVGPMSGTDTYEYSGAITAFEMAGPAVVRINGSVVDPKWDLPTYLQAMTMYDIEAAMDSTDGWHTIQFTNPNGITAYEIEVAGTIRSTSDTRGDLPSPSSYVTGHIGPTSGTDTYELTGNLRHFELVGACDVYVDGSPVTAGQANTIPADDGRRWTLVLANTTDTTLSYRAIVTGDATVEDTEFNEGIAPQPDGTSIVEGTVGADDSDEIWFTGRIEGLSFDEGVVAYLDGEPISTGDYPPA